MHTSTRTRVAVAVAAALLALARPAGAQDSVKGSTLGNAPGGPAGGDATSLEALNQRINDQVRRLAELRRALDREEASLLQMRRSVGDAVIARQRGGSAAPEAMVAVSTATPAAAAGQPATAAAAGTQAGATAAALRTAPIFEEPSVLTGRGRFVLEPSLQYSNSSNNRISLVGYTIIPALLVGLVDVREVKRNTTTAAFTGRYGLTQRLELEARVPYIYRSDTTKWREIATGSAMDMVTGASGKGLGDVEVAARYQLGGSRSMLGGEARSTYVASLRYKSRTGTDPFEVVTDCQTRCVGNATGTGTPLQLPTGSGFHSLQTGLTWLTPIDPVVLFGTFSYLHNVPRRDVQRQVLNGERESLGKISPGGVVGFNLGLGLALNDTSSFSVGYDHASVAPTKQNGSTVPGSIRAQLGTLLFGYSHRVDTQRSVSFSLGAGLTPDAPDVTLVLRMPFNL